MSRTQRWAAIGVVLFIGFSLTSARADTYSTGFESADGFTANSSINGVGPSGNTWTAASFANQKVVSGGYSGSQGWNISNTTPSDTVIASRSPYLSYPAGETGTQDSRSVSAATDFITVQFDWKHSSSSYDGSILRMSLDDGSGSRTGGSLLFFDNGFGGSFTQQWNNIANGISGSGNEFLSSPPLLLDNWYRTTITTQFVDGLADTTSGLEMPNDVVTIKTVNLQDNNSVVWELDGTDGASTWEAADFGSGLGSAAVSAVVWNLKFGDLGGAAGTAGYEIDNFSLSTDVEESFQAGDVNMDGVINDDDHWELAYVLDTLSQTTSGPTPASASVSSMFPNLNPDVDLNSFIDSEDSRALAEDMLGRMRGDTDIDTDVDIDDIIMAAGNFTGPGGSGKHWAVGDSDGDGDVDIDDIIQAAGNFTGPIAAGNVVDGPGNADLIYDPATGNVKIDAAEASGGEVIGFSLVNAAGGLDFNAPGVATFPSGGLTTDSVTAIGWSDPFNPGFTGILDLGNIFPTGLDLTGLAAFLTTANYTGSAGTGLRVLDLVVVAAAAEAVPEPGTLFLLGMGALGLGLSLRRRRRG